MLRVVQARERRIQRLARRRRHRFGPLPCRSCGLRGWTSHPDDQGGHLQPEGAGSVEQLRSGHAQFRVPDRGVDDEHEPVAIHVRQLRMRGQRRRQAGTQPLVQRVEPKRTPHRITGGTQQQGIECLLRLPRAFRARPGAR